MPFFKAQKCKIAPLLEWNRTSYNPLFDFSLIYANSNLKSNFNQKCESCLWALCRNPKDPTKFYLWYQSVKPRNSRNFRFPTRKKQRKQLGISPDSLLNADCCQFSMASHSMESERKSTAFLLLFLSYSACTSLCLESWT